MLSVTSLIPGYFSFLHNYHKTCIMNIKPHRYHNLHFCFLSGNRKMLSHLSNFSFFPYARPEYALNIRQWTLRNKQSVNNTYVSKVRKKKRHDTIHKAVQTTSPW